MRVVKKRWKWRWKWKQNEFPINLPAVIAHGLAHITLVISQARLCPSSFMSIEHIILLLRNRVDTLVGGRGDGDRKGSIE